MNAMTSSQAEQLLSQEDVLSCAQGSMTYIKQLRDQCLEQDIPAMIVRACGSGGG